jgi:L-malate glycosyltransferase
LSKIRIAIIVPAITQNGPIKVIEDLVNCLCDYKDVNIKVFYLDNTVDTSIKMIVPVFHYDPASFCFNEFDIVQTNGIRPDFIAFMNRKRIRFHITTIHSFIFEDLTFTYNKLISAIFGGLWLIFWKRADILVCVSDTMKHYYEKWIPENKLAVIHNGIHEHDDSFVPDFNIVNRINSLRSKGLTVIGCCGNLTKRKGIDQLVSVLDEQEDLGLVIIGNGKEYNHLKSLSVKRAVAERCIFLGFVTHAVNYFKYFDLFVIASRSEGFGLTLIEAVQQKVPVVCSDLQVFKELLNSDEVTFFELENKYSLIEAIQNAIVTGNRKTNQAYSRYREYYTNQIMAKGYYELFKSA